MKLRKFALLGIAPLVLAAAFVAACGGGDGDGGGTGSDEAYVAAVCKAGAKFQEDLFAALGTMDFDAPEEDQLKAFEEPFKNFADSLNKAKPPADLKAWHENAVKTINTMVSDIRNGNMDALEGEEDPLGDPPPAAAARLQAIAEKNQECIDADFTFD